MQCLVLLGMSSEQLKGHLDPLVLAVLEDGPVHGYGIIEQLRLRSAAVFDLAEGTVYPALHRLERAGLVSSAIETVGGRDRRVYRLSRQGRVSLRERRREWVRFSSAVTSILGVTPA
jgi:PadR family transcriptional regulator PadR